MQKFVRNIIGTNNVYNSFSYCQSAATMGRFCTVGYGDKLARRQTIRMPATNTVLHSQPSNMKRKQIPNWCSFSNFLEKK